MQRVLCMLCDAVHALPAVQASWLSPPGATVCMLKHPVTAQIFPRQRFVYCLQMGLCSSALLREQLNNIQHCTPEIAVTGVDISHDYTAVLSVFLFPPKLLCDICECTGKPNMRIF